MKGDQALTLFRGDSAENFFLHFRYFKKIFYGKK